MLGVVEMEGCGLEVLIARSERAGYLRIGFLSLDPSGLQGNCRLLGQRL